MDIQIVQMGLWLLAGLASLYFSIGNARVWTSISLGFVLMLLSGLMPALLPHLPALHSPQLQAFGYVSGVLAIILVTQGVQEYYMFSRTLEEEGEKLHVYLMVLALLTSALIFIYINPVPTAGILETLSIVENSCWVFLALVNIDMVRKISLEVKGTPIGKGFIAFFLVFGSIFLWKGAELYLQVYPPAEFAAYHPGRYLIAGTLIEVGSVLTSISIAGAFLYLSRLLR